MEIVEQTASYSVSTIFESESVRVAAVEFTLCDEDFKIIRATLESEDTLREFPEFKGLYKVYQDEDCGFVPKAEHNTLNIEVIVLVPSQEIIEKHGENCIQGYRVWLEYEYAIESDASVRIELNCKSIDVEEEFITEINNPVDPDSDLADEDLPEANNADDDDDEYGF